MLTPTVFELTFQPDRLIEFIAGQFVSVVIPGAGPAGRNLRRAYSIASHPESPLITLCIKIVEDGPGTSYLQKLKPGDVLQISAPFGDFVFKTPLPSTAVFLIATGTGISPFRSIVFSKGFQTRESANTFCLLGVRSEEELLFPDEFASSPHTQWVPALSRPASPDWKGFRGRVTDYLRQLGPGFHWRECEFYLCGSGEMIEEAKALLLERGVPKSAIHQEVYYRPVIKK